MRINIVILQMEVLCLIAHGQQVVGPTWKRRAVQRPQLMLRHYMHINLVTQEPSILWPDTKAQGAKCYSGETGFLVWNYGR